MLNGAQCHEDEWGSGHTTPQIHTHGYSGNFHTADTSYPAKRAHVMHRIGGWVESILILQEKAKSLPPPKTNANLLDVKPIMYLIILTMLQKGKQTGNVHIMQH